MTGLDVLTDTQLRALAHPVRRDILRILGTVGGECDVMTLTAAVGLSGPRTSQHLKELRESGLVTRRVDRTRRMYRSNEGALRSIAAVIGVLAR